MDINVVEIKLMSNSADGSQMEIVMKGGEAGNCNKPKYRGTLKYKAYLRILSQGLQLPMQHCKSVLTSLKG